MDIDNLFKQGRAEMQYTDSFTEGLNEIANNPNSTVNGIATDFYKEAADIYKTTYEEEYEKIKQDNIDDRLVNSTQKEIIKPIGTIATPFIDMLRHKFEKRKIEALKNQIEEISHTEEIAENEEIIEKTNEEEKVMVRTRNNKAGNIFSTILILATTIVTGIIIGTIIMK